MKKLSLEFPVKSSIRVLFNAISTPSGLSEWFCDDVNIIEQGKYWDFFWEGEPQRALFLGGEEDLYIRWRWEEYDDKTYFELRIDVDDITGDIELLVTDFTDEDEEDTTIALWESQIKDLFKSVGV
jgi:uncharacterized protein YndB with AHSA1/START domain